MLDVLDNKIAFCRECKEETFQVCHYVALANSLNGYINPREVLVWQCELCNTNLCKANKVEDIESIRYDLPIEVNEKQYSALKSELDSYIAYRQDADGRYYIKVWLMSCKEEVIRIINQYKN